MKHLTIHGIMFNFMSFVTKAAGSVLASTNNMLIIAQQCVAAQFLLSVVSKQNYLLMLKVWHIKLLL